VPPAILAQAVLEHGMLDSALTDVSNAITGAGSFIQTRPWVWVVLAVVLFLLVRRRR